MATYYIRTTGSDAAAGTSAATAWQTIGKAMTTLAAADICYVGAGHYRTSTALTPTNSGSAGSAISLLGDTDGSKTGDSGEIVVSNYATNDTTAASNINVFAFGSASYWTLGSMSVINGYIAYSDTANACVSAAGTGTNITLQDLTLQATTAGIVFDVTWPTAPAHAVNRCRILSGRSGIYVSGGTSATGTEVDLAITVNNCLILAFGASVNCNGKTTSTTRRSGGVTVKNCTLISQYCLLANSAYWSTTYKLSGYNNFMLAAQYACLCNTSGQIAEDYNVIFGSQGARSNVTAGANSISDSSRNPRLSQGHEGSYGGTTRSFGEWPSGSPLLTWGGTAVPTDDINGITRPASGASQTTAQQALGPYERSNSATKETTTTRTGGTAIKIAGPGYQDFELAVTPGTANVVVWSYKDTAYGTAATGPQLIVTNGGEAGFGGTTVTSAGSTATWAAMTATITPTSAGIVTVRLQSNATVGSAAAYFDDFSVT